MAHKFIIALDRAHLRIYRFSQQPGQFTPSIQPVDAVDLSEGPASYADNVADVAGRFSGVPARAGGTSVDERPVVQEDRDRYVVEQLVARITAFLQRNPNSTWDLAAGSALHNRLLEALPDPVRRRLDKVITKDLVNAPPMELREHFALR